MFQQFQKTFKMKFPVLFTLVEDNLNERQPQRKTTLMEDNLNGKKMSMEDNLNGRRP